MRSVASAKPPGYYGLVRADVVAQLPRPIGRVLDVGCGEGGVGRSLRAAGASEIWGVEVHPEAARSAASSLDTVVNAPIDEALADGRIAGPFDTICCYDVLEHLVDPFAVLGRLRSVATNSGRLHISLPNARHFSLIYDLVVRGTFGYTSHGHRDDTHLRWYTRSDLLALVAAAGWRVDWAVHAPFRGRDRHADRLTGGRAREFLALQWHVLAHAS